jgi:Domain of unknown function (DUF5753)/Helix-turn-helix domain
VRAAAIELEWSEAKIWRIETGQTSLRSLDVEAMCRAYGADAKLTEALMGLAKETKSKGWWLAYGDVIPESFDLYLGLEEAASELTWYESELIPGLLQTADYARTLISADNPGVDADEVERRVNLRIERQTLLTRVTAPPDVRVVLNEAIIRRPVGGEKVLASQLEQLVEVSQLPHVSLRVIPFSAGLHAGVMSGPFVVLRFPATNNGASEPDTVYVDGFTGALYLDKPNEVRRYDSAWQDIQDSSLDERASRDLITTTVKELRP